MSGGELDWRPWRLLRSPTPWRAWVYTASGAVLGAFTLVVVLALTAVGIVLSPLGIGLVLLTAVGLVGLPIGAVERRRLRLLGRSMPVSPHRAMRAARPGRWLAVRLREGATWRAFAFTMLLCTGLWLLDFLAAAIPVAGLGVLCSSGSYLVSGHTLAGIEVRSPAGIGLGLVIAVAGMYLVTAVAALYAAAARNLLSCKPADDSLAVIEAGERLVDAYDAERRRIERDLHDGVQQRLVALAVQLDLARMRAGPDLVESLTRAHADATTTLAELRELVQGIHPHVLTERGLPEAVAELVTRCPIAVDVRLRIAGRLPSTVESTAYFAVSEALTNVVKHADAERAWVTGRVDGDVLIVEIGDSGRGGLDPALGSGVRGLADRVAVVGGRLSVSSPPGGPTLVRVDVPVAA